MSVAAAVLLVLGIIGTGLVSGVVYVVGAIGVTAAANVPRNNRPAAAPEGDEGALGDAVRGQRRGLIISSSRPPGASSYSRLRPVRV